MRYVPQLRHCLLNIVSVIPLAGLAPSPTTAQGYGQSHTRTIDNSHRAPDYIQSPALPIYYPPIWQGLYLGGHAGGEFGSLRSSDATNEKIDLYGVSAGLHVGYNGQVDNFVVGFEFDGNAKSTEGQRSFAGPVRFDASEHWLTSLRLRVGVAAGNTLIYATGGYAVGNVDLTISAPAIALRASEVVQGYVLGGGVEFKFSPNVSARIEGLHYGFGEKAFNFSRISLRGDGELTTIRAGMTYHFN